MKFPRLIRKNRFKKADSTSKGTKSNLAGNIDEAETCDENSSNTNVFKKYTVHISLLQVFSEKNKFYGSAEQIGSKEREKKDLGVSPEEGGIIDMLFSIKRIFGSSAEKHNSSGTCNDVSSKTNIFKKYTVNINLLQVFSKTNNFYGCTKQDGKNDRKKRL